MFDSIKFWKNKNNRQSQFLISLGTAQGKVQIAELIVEENIELMIRPIIDAVNICKDIFSDKALVLENLLEYCNKKEQELFK